MTTSMADRLKKKISAKSITGYLVFGAIILVFVGFGMTGNLGGGVGQVARVNNTYVSIADYQHEEERIRQYYASLFGNGMDFSSQRQLLQQQAVENLVRMELVSQAAQKMGVLATDAEIRDFIVRDIPVFQQSGMFQKELYLRYLESSRSTPGDFEAKIRKDIQNIRTRRLFESASAPLKIEKDKALAIRGLKANFSIAQIDESKLLDSKTGKGRFTREQLDAELLKIDSALSSGNTADVEKLVSNLGVSWEDTGMIEVASENWPKVTSAVLKDAAFELTKKDSILKRLVRDGNVKYVLKLKDAKEEAVLVASPEDIMFQRRRADGLFDAWLNQYRNTSKVEINNSIFTK